MYSRRASARRLFKPGTMLEKGIEMAVNIIVYLLTLYFLFRIFIVAGSGKIKLSEPETMEKHNRQFKPTPLDWKKYEHEFKKDWTIEEKTFHILMCKKLQQETRSTKEIAMISNDEMARWKKLTGVDVKEKEREEKRLRPRKEGDKQIYLKAVKGNTQSFEL
jgi:hypothetical protein